MPRYMTNYDEYDTYWKNGGYKKISDIIFAEWHIFIFLIFAFTFDYKYDYHATKFVVYTRYLFSHQVFT